MTTVIAPVVKDQVSELISSFEGDKLAENELKIFNSFIAASVAVYSGLVNDKVLCLWGLIPPTLLSDQAYLWLYTTPAAEEHQFILVRRGQIEMKKMLEEYPKIVGHCEVGAERSIRWLKWLGAEFGAADGKLIPFLIQRQGA
jgi:hypothetical protein